MVWFKVDDDFPTSRKVLSIPRRRRAAAVGVWTLAGAWSSGELTGGYVPDYALDEIASGPEMRSLLVNAGLWVQVSRGEVRFSPTESDDSSEVETYPHDGIRFHDWDHYQPSRADVLKDRQEHAARQKAYRDRMKAKRDAERDASRVTAGDVTRDGGVTAARPDPTRPDPTVVPTELLEGVAAEAPTKPRATRGHRLPDDFVVTDAMREWARGSAHGVDVDRATLRFRNHWLAESGAKASKVDWVAAWRTWLLKDADTVRPAGNSYQRQPGERKAMY